MARQPCFDNTARGHRREVVSGGERARRKIFLGSKAGAMWRGREVYAASSFVLPFLSGDVIGRPGARVWLVAVVMVVVCRMHSCLLDTLACRRLVGCGSGLA